MVKIIESLAQLPKDRLLRMSTSQPDTQAQVYRFDRKVSYGGRIPSSLYFEVLNEQQDR